MANHHTENGAEALGTNEQDTVQKTIILTDNNLTNNYFYAPFNTKGDLMGCCAKFDFLYEDELSALHTIYEKDPLNWIPLNPHSGIIDYNSVKKVNVLIGKNEIVAAFFKLLPNSKFSTGNKLQNMAYGSKVAKPTKYGKVRFQVVHGQLKYDKSADEIYILDSKNNQKQSSSCWSALKRFFTNGKTQELN